MALSAKLMMRQGQALVMTPQLLQAIKLLQLSNIELASFIDEELERNPLLERADDAPSAHEAGDPPEAPAAQSEERDWTAQEFATDQRDLETSLGTELSNSFDADRGGGSVGESHDGHGLSMTNWTAGGSGAVDGDHAGPEGFLTSPPTLAERLIAQMALLPIDAVDRMIGHVLLDAIDESGYLREPVDAVAVRLGVEPARVERILGLVQGFEPTGVGARDLSECLRLQLAERDRLDPAMQTLLEHLPLLARRDFSALRKICGVDEEDLRDMLAEIRALDPKPGRQFESTPVQTAVPDVYVSAAADGSWHVELNTEVLPRILVNQRYHARVSRNGGSDADKAFVSNCLQNANWLTKSLEQRARTILKVSSEIIRQQDAFFAHGVEHLRPLNLRSVADPIGMHESTVSRVTSNKYMATPRGLFELKYFFTAAIAASRGADSHSAEAVRYRIKQMIDAESPSSVLSDDAIVVRLRQANIDIARRTVAKYRESLRIPSSVERRREKGVPGLGLDVVLAR